MDRVSDKVLIIEDEKNIRNAVARVLELSGYEVVLAENGTEGIKQINEKYPDIVLCDINMPEMNGFDVLKEIKSSNDNWAPPFIFVTAKVERSDIRKGMNLGAVDYITKPFTTKELLEAIDSKLSQYSELQNSVLNKERERISEELHGNIQQLLVAANLNLEAMLKNVEERENNGQFLLSNCKDLIREALSETRKISHELSPETLLKDGIEACINKSRIIILASGKINFDFTYNVLSELDSRFELSIHRVIQELINNTLKHSNATEIKLDIQENPDGEVLIDYKDNGIGFDINVSRCGMGLNSIYNKVKHLDGLMNVSSKIGKYSHFKFKIPIPTEAHKSSYLV